MADKNSKQNSLKTKFEKVESRLKPNKVETGYIDKKNRVDTVKTQAIEKIDTTFVEVNSKKIKSYKKVLIQAEKQLFKNKEDLKRLVDSKRDNHYKLEMLVEGIRETESNVIHVDDSIKELKHERGADEVRLGRLQTKKVELEHQLSELKAQKSETTTNYNSLLNAIYQKEDEVSKLEDDLKLKLDEVEKIQTLVVKESKKLKALNEDFQKIDFRTQRVAVDNKQLLDEYKDVKQNIDKYESLIDECKHNIIRLNSDNTRLEHNLRDLDIKNSELQKKYELNFNEVEKLRDLKSSYSRRRDEIINNIKAFKIEHSKNILELEARNREKLDLEREIALLLDEKVKLENVIFSQQAKSKSLDSSIIELRREKSELEDSIKLGNFQKNRFETEMVRLRNETNSLQEQYNLLINENERVKREAQIVRTRFVDVEGKRNLWKEKSITTQKSIENYKNQISESHKAIDELSKDLKLIKNDISVKENDIKRLHKAYTDASKQVNEVRSEHEETSKKYKRVLKEKSGWSERIAQREDYLQKMVDKVSAIKENIYESEREVEQRQLLLDDIGNKIVMLQSQEKCLKAEQKDKLRIKHEFTEKVEQAQKEVSSLEGQKNTIEQELARINIYIEKQKAHIPTISEQNNILTAAIEGAKSEHKSLGNELILIKRKIEEERQKNKSLEEKFQKIHLVFEEKNNEKKELLSKMSKLEQERSEYKAKIETRKNSIEKISLQISKDKIALMNKQNKYVSEKNSYEKEVAELKKTLHSQALMLQSEKVKSHSSSNEQKLKQIKDLKNKYQEYEKQIVLLRNSQSDKKLKVEELENKIKQLEHKNDLYAKTYELEMAKKSNLTNKLSALKDELDRLNSSVVTHATIVDKIKAENNKLERQHTQMDMERNAKIQKLYDEEQMLQLEDEPVLNSEKSFRDLRTTFDGISKNIHNTKNAQILKKVTTDLVQIISDNEFENLEWKCKVSSNESLDGIKITFENMQTQYSEMKRMLKPVVRNLAKEFSCNGLKITTRSKTSPGDVVELIEFVVTTQKPKTKDLSVNN